RTRWSRHRRGHGDGDAWSGPSLLFASLVLPRSFLRSGRVSPRTLNGPAATGSGGRLDLALDDPFVVGHRHAVGLVVDHVDGLVGGGGDGGLRALHALHVFGLESDLGAVGQTLVSGVLDLFLHDPLVILDRIPAGGGREVHRVGVGVERAGDRGVCAVHALHVFGGERDLGAGRVLRRRSLLDALGGGAAVHRTLHPAAVRTAAPVSLPLGRAVDEGVAWSWSPPLLQPVSTSAPPSTPAATVVMRRLRIKSPIHSGPINIIPLWGIGQISIGGRGIAQLRSSRPGAAAVMLQPRVVEGSGHVGGVLGWNGVEGRSAAWAAEPEALPVVVAE